MKKILLSTILIALLNTLFGQTVPEFSQRSLDMQMYNPAVVGSEVNHVIQLHHRAQWVGFTGAPRTSVVSYAGALNPKMGLGASMFYDAAGPVRNYGANLAYSYHLQFDKVNLALGASASAAQYTINNGEIKFADLWDPAVSTQYAKSKLIPDISAGFYLYNKKFYIGGSANQMLEGKMKDGLQSSIPSSQRYYAMAGYNFIFSNSFVLTPNAVFVGSSASPAQFELGLKVQFPQHFIAGVSARWNDAVSMLFGVYIQKRIMIAYSYDYVYTELRNYHSGSHEIILKYNLFNSFPIKTMYDRSGLEKNRPMYWE